MVKARENEPLESLMKRFKKQVEDEGILKDYREKQYFIKPSAKRHQMIRRAKRRAQLEQKNK